MLKIISRKQLIVLLVGFFGVGQSYSTFAQYKRPPIFSIIPADTLHLPRLKTTSALIGAAYTGTLIGLQEAWYKDYPMGKFRFFNDSQEWMQMDKMGHLFTSYNESRWVYHGARWTGLKEKRSAWIGFAGGQILQATFEVMDGFSTQWGFSVYDIATNALGSTTFFAQQLAWKEQRIMYKMSSTPINYPDLTLTSTNGLYQTSLKARADDLYGSGPINLFLKNYNALTIWGSVNIWSFLPNRAESKFPRWLNVAVGYGADNLFEGFAYEWTAPKGCIGPDCEVYRVDRNMFPRTRQFYLSPDVDLTRIKVKNRYLRSLLIGLNIFKIPAPALEVTSSGKFIFHALRF